MKGCFYVRADRPNNSQLPLIVGNAACRAGNEAKTYKTFWPKVFEAGLFARSGYQPISHQLTPHTRGVAVGGAALTFSKLFLARTAAHPRRALGGRRLVRAICGSHIQDPPTHPYLGLLGFRIHAFEFSVWCFGFRDSGLGFRV